MVAIKVKLQRRPSGKYESIVITLPKEILDAASPKFKTTKAALLDVDKGNIIVKAA